VDNREQEFGGLGGSFILRTRGFGIFPEKHRPTHIRFVVDMSDQAVKRGLTNPAGVSRLCQIGEVKSLDGLHAKVLLFDGKVALVGSANFSRNSIEGQRQCCILTTDKRFSLELRTWLEDIWTTATPVQQKDCKRSQHIFPKPSGRHGQSPHRASVRLKTWRTQLEDFSLEPAEFRIGLTKREIAKAIRLFQTTQCGYIDPQDETVTCATVAKRGEQREKRLRKEFRALLQNIDHWGRDDKERLFDIAYTNGRAAVIRKPLFLAHPITKIRRTMQYLFLEDHGDPLIRFEHAVRGQFKLFGMSYSGVAFLMHLWKPNDFAVWNGSVDKGLRKLKVTVRRPFSRNVAQGYRDRIAALKQIMKLTGLKTFHGVDHFVDAFGKDHLTL
jgi:hypothetical protein